MLIDKCGYGNYDNIRASAVSALSFFISDKNGNIKNPGYDRVAELLHDKSVPVRNNVCVALGRAFLYTKNPAVIAELEKVAEEDVDGQIRESANESIRLINKDREILEMIKSVPNKEQFISDKLHFMERRIADS